jgi:hypothetical protein
MKAHRGKSGTALLIGNFSTRQWHEGNLQTNHLPQGKKPHYPLNRRPSGPHTGAGCFGGVKNVSPLLEINPRSANP